MDKLSVFLKTLRLKNNDERLSDMAKKLGVSASYLSTIENEKRPMTDKLFNAIVKNYQLDQEETQKLTELSQMAAKKINIPINDLDEDKKKTVIKFLSNIESMTEEEMEKINLLLNKKK